MVMECHNAYFLVIVRLTVLLISSTVSERKLSPDKSRMIFYLYDPSIAKLHSGVFGMSKSIYTL